MGDRIVTVADSTTPVLIVACITVFKIIIHTYIHTYVCAYAYGDKKILPEAKQTFMLVSHMAVYGHLCMIK